ncbi:MAG TPA: hypothetical protein DDZ81_05965 [Acetobacteraceae bacterium]|jgi:VanZ family protein|nr:hypothetical protein [Acetobacteraceae bacterium]
MNSGIPALSSRWQLAGLALLYAAVMLYSSTVVGPAGMNFVYRPPAEALWTFLATPYVEHGSDQRADWIGNLMMLVPFGFITTGALWPRRTLLRVPAAVAAMVVCVAVILAIKYLQLFFPPRTVTLNYIMAQTAGALTGCCGWATWQARVGRLMVRRDLVGAFVLALWLYSGALVLFTLMPLDFALNADDLRTQLLRFPSTLWAIPGSGRPPQVRAVLVFMAGAAFIPVGMLLTFTRQGVYRVRRGLPTVTIIGLLVTTGLYAVSSLVLSAFPVAPSILYRTLGIVAGAAALRWLVRQDADALRRWLRRAVPFLVAPYLLGVLVVNQVISRHWISWQEVMAQGYPLGLLPLFDYYIVTKAEAAKNIVGHVVLYMPVGALFWMRYGEGGAGRAGVTAALLSLCVEVARYFRPGLEGDLNAVVVGGVAAVLGAKLMPAIWEMFAALAGRSGPSVVRRWDKGSGGRASMRALGDIEQF